ncbi:hypothetical protein PAECIP111893_02584 [Paenibacillus plantiphilus]|uniref:Uncharacterized protein n=1 Tax=Paenibacillus plantiphilus TaxID=2905650 RepID=A0ABM9CB22_9BACL|nr:hypothetical protein PAECIP111893_02584 [Paenibacillus plantiphilus]
MSAQAWRGEGSGTYCGYDRSPWHYGNACCAVDAERISGIRGKRARQLGEDGELAAGICQWGSVEGGAGEAVRANDWWSAAKQSVWTNRSHRRRDLLRLRHGRAGTDVYRQTDLQYQPVHCRSRWKAATAWRARGTVHRRRRLGTGILEQTGINGGEICSESVRAGRAAI